MASKLGVSRIGSSFTTRICSQVGHGLTRSYILHTRSSIYDGDAGFYRSGGPLIHRMRLATISQAILESLQQHRVIPDVVDSFVPSALLSVDYENDHHAALGNTLKYSEAKDQPRFTITPIDEPEVAPSPSIFSQAPKYTIVMTDPDAVVQIPAAAESAKETENGAGRGLVQGHFVHLVISGVQLTPLGSTLEPAEVDSKNGQHLLEYVPPDVPAVITSSSTQISSPSTVTNVDGSTSPSRSSSAGSKTAAPPRRHRYVFLLFREDTRQSPRPPGARMHWGFEDESTEEKLSETDTAAALTTTTRRTSGAREWARLYGLTLVGANFFYLE
ncbi:hypothetical protein BZA70DRAFT_278815 [Myxozyma melibiosi]|uniref:Uncharacterized protein n=1 Tax=Myxozyma melibiosi TaxID=54550 RepID=A0ABR1F5B6_9ASCO